MSSRLDEHRGYFNMSLLHNFIVLFPSKEKDEQKCELCQIEQENMEHFLLRCPALNEKRKITLSKLKQTLIQSTGQDKWTETIVGNKTLFSLNLVQFAGHLNRKCSIFSCSIWHGSHFCSSFSFENLCISD
jgi:hypothetical protein